MTMPKITSLINPKVKDAVKLRQRNKREENGLTLIEGERELVMALKARVEVREVFFCPELASEETARITGALRPKLRDRFYDVTPAVYEKLAFGERKDGVIAVACPRAMDLGQLPLGPRPLIVIVDHVEKPGNLGALLRSCDATGVDALIVTDPATDIFNPNVIRASLGTVFSVPVAEASAAGVLRFCRDRSIRILATSPDGKQVYTKTDLKGAVALAVGREDHGLSSEWLRQADETVRIPMRGAADSLNVSVSLAVILFEALRQRGL